MKTWTIKVNENLDQLIERLVRELGYTSKAEFVRDAVRRQVLEVGLTKLGVSSAERHATWKEDPLRSLEQIVKASKKLTEKELKSLVERERQEVEAMIFGED